MPVLILWVAVIAAAALKLEVPSKWHSVQTDCFPTPSISSVGCCTE